MGKVLVIKGADFSKVAIEKISVDVSNQAKLFADMSNINLDGTINKDQWSKNYKVYKLYRDEAVINYRFNIQNLNMGLPQFLVVAAYNDSGELIKDIRANDGGNHSYDINVDNKNSELANTFYYLFCTQKDNEWQVTAKF